MRVIVVRRAKELGVKGRATIIIKMEDKIVEKPVRDIDALLIIGSRVKLTAAVPTVLAAYGIPIAFIAKNNIALAINPIIINYNNYRYKQYTLPKINALTIALEYIKAKINGMVNILKYHRRHPSIIQDPPKPSSDEDTYETEIRLWESINSSKIWTNLLNLLKPNYLKELREKYGLTGRKPQHKDPFNKTLSVMYTVLYSLATKALVAAGLDPTYGFLHKTKYSTPLTFDYTEMFKPIAIEATIQLINKEGIPELDNDGELTAEWINTAIKYLYNYLTLQHKDTKKTLYQQIYLKAFCLAKHLDNKCKKEKLTVTWNRLLYRKHKRTP